MRNASPDVKCPLTLLLIQELNDLPIRSTELATREANGVVHGANFVLMENSFSRVSQFMSCVSCTSTMCKTMIPSTFWCRGPVAIWYIIRCFLADWCLEKRVPSIKYDATTTSDPTSTPKWWHSGTILNRWIWWRLDTCCHQLLRVERSCK
jgi:hypothetical protein